MYCCEVWVSKSRECSPIAKLRAVQRRKKLLSNYSHLHIIFRFIVQFAKLIPTDIVTLAQTYEIHTQKHELIKHDRLLFRVNLRLLQTADELERFKHAPTPQIRGTCLIFFLASMSNYHAAQEFDRPIITFTSITFSISWLLHQFYVNMYGIKWHEVSSFEKILTLMLGL